MMARSLILLVLSVSWFPLTSIKPAIKNAGTLRTIVLDAGHGGHDPGCMAGGAKEKIVTLQLVLQLGKMIQDSLPGVKVLYTRQTDKFLELWERPQVANKAGADLFISIHCNSNNKTTVSGTETFAMGLHKSEGNLDVAKRENSAILLEKNYSTNQQYEGFDPESPEAHIIFSLYQNAHLVQSLKLASHIEKEFANDSARNSRGVKQAGFLVLWKTTMPSVLVESGFLTHPAERSYLTSDAGQKAAVYSIFKAIRNYKKDTEKPPADTLQIKTGNTGAGGGSRANNSSPAGIQKKN